MQRPKPESLPLTPGVYLYKDSAERILYVGKARVLRRRVLSYFRDDVPAKTAAMLRHACSLETLSTTTEKEALLLEASLIKKHRPRYNIVLRDDKQYVLFRLNLKHPFPRLDIVRKARQGKGGARDGARYFGPFSSATAARETFKLIHRVFPLRRCTDRALKNRVKPCLYYHMGQCCAPCMGEVTPADYFVGVQPVIELLSGRTNDLLRELEQKMLTAAESLDFEQAARLRDQLQAVQRTVEQQSAVLANDADMDVLGLHPSARGMALSLLFVRGGRLLDGRSFFWSGLGWDDAPELLWTFLSQFYASGSGEGPPQKIVVPWIVPPQMQEEGPTPVAAVAAVEGEEESLVELETMLSQLREKPVRIMAPRTADEHRLVDMAVANAREEARQRQDVPITERLTKALHLPVPPLRIECVDVSHTSGQQTRVGMVVFEDGRPLTSAYRDYAMPDGGGDDYGVLAAWVARRLESGPPWADLLLIDGGKGQLAVVARALQEAGQSGLFSLAAIAKARDEQGHADRRAGNVGDRIFLLGRSNPLPLKEGCPELLFLQHVRDCTHRFAIGRHRRARTGAALAGELMRLPGIGPHTARLLWDYFGSVEAMAQASCAELCKVPNIGKATAAKLFEKLKSLR
ncbi:MAG: excinuclease ABC subunit UvrC [Desulfovibrionaceae bacterium]